MVHLSSYPLAGRLLGLMAWIWVFCGRERLRQTHLSSLASVTVGMKQQWVTHRFMPSDSNWQEYLLKSTFHCAGGNGPYCKYRQISLKWFAQPCLPLQLLGREVVMEPCRQCALALGAASPQVVGQRVGHSGQEAVWAKLALCPSPLIEKLLLTCKNWRRKYLYERNKRKWP